MHAINQTNHTFRRSPVLRRGGGDGGVQEQTWSMLRSLLGLGTGASAALTASMADLPRRKSRWMTHTMCTGSRWCCGAALPAAPALHAAGRAWGQRRMRCHRWMRCCSRGSVVHWCLGGAGFGGADAITPCCPRCGVGAQPQLQNTQEQAGLRSGCTCRQILMEKSDGGSVLGLNATHGAAWFVAMRIRWLVWLKQQRN